RADCRRGKRPNALAGSLPRERHKLLRERPAKARSGFRLPCHLRTKDAAIARNKGTEFQRAAEELGVGASREAAAAVERREECTFGGEGEVQPRVINRPDGFARRAVRGAAFNRERTLGRCWQHLFVTENVVRTRGNAQARE